jgi:hypothetical protein
MAKLLQTALTPISGLRGGVILYNSGNQQWMRHKVQPLQPGTNPQAYATVSIAQLAAFWAALTPDDQATWDTPLVPKTSPYTNFIAFNQVQVTWGAAPNSAPNFGPLAGGFVGPDCFVDNTTGKAYIVVTYGAIIPDGWEYYMQLYWGYQYTQTNIPPSNSPLIYVGRMGPLVSEVSVAAEITATVQAILGQVPPGSPILGPMVPGGGFQFYNSVYICTANNNYTETIYPQPTAPAFGLWATWPPPYPVTVIGPVDGPYGP